MFRISLRRMLPSLTRSYATAPSTTKLFPAPIHARYDPEEDPQLAGLDYPKVSELSRQTRSARGWWDSQERINFDEAVPENDDVQSMWAPDIHKVAPFYALSQLIGAGVGVAAFAGVVYLIQASPPGLPRAYPHDGLANALPFGARKSEENVIEE